MSNYGHTFKLVETTKESCLTFINENTTDKKNNKKFIEEKCFVEKGVALSHMVGDCYEIGYGYPTNPQQEHYVENHYVNDDTLRVQHLLMYNFYKVDVSKFEYHKHVKKALKSLYGYNWLNTIQEKYHEKEKKIS